MKKYFRSFLKKKNIKNRELFIDSQLIYQLGPNVLEFKNLKKV
jgi:hypothetical protein